MTIAKDFASKAVMAVVASAMVLSAFAPAAQAQTTEDLQTMINDLLAQVAALQSTTGQGANSVASGICPYTWTRDLSSGSTGADVMKLQQFLNADADTRVAAEGAGSVGMETEYFGPATAAAVSKMQVKYRAEILSPAGLVNPTGYFGPSSRAVANSKCVVTTPVEDMDDEDMTDEDDEDMDDEDMELSGEASLDTAELQDGESTIEEGDEDVVIGEFTVEFADGDAEISRIDVALTATGADAWDAFETITLWVDGDMVAEMDASDEDEYLDEDAGEIRFSGLDIVGMEDEELEILVGATVQNNLDSEELTDWELEVTSLRFFDADGVSDTVTDPANGDKAEFEVQEAGTDEELDVSLSSSNPDSTDIVVDTDTDTNDVTILVADLEANDNDIELNTVVVRVDITGATSSDIQTMLDDVRVVIDGEEFDAEAIGTENDYNASADDETPSGATGLSEGYSELASATTSVWYLFDIDGDVVVEEDAEVTLEVVVDFNDTDDGDRYPNGSTIKATIAGELAFWDAEGAEDLSSGQFDGSAVGDTHTLVAEGILVPVDGFSSEEDTLGQNDTIGEFTLEFEVSAIEGDFYITENAAPASTSPSNGIVYTVDGTTATITDSLTSTADEDTTGVFTVREGETETFTLVVTVDPAAAGTFRVQLDEIIYSANANGTSNPVTYEVTPVTDFRSAPQAINQ